MSLRFFILIFLFFVAQKLIAQNVFRNQVEILLNQEDYKNAMVGMHVVDLNSGKTIYSLNPEKLLIPASTLKIITTGVALELLGADYRFKTNLAYLGDIKGNVLKGDLVLVGGGDPTLGSEYFQNHYYNFLENWAKKVKSSGISKIEGDLILDASAYDSEKVPASWIWEDMGNYYGAGANAFTTYDNMFRITFRSPNREGEKTKIIASYPKINELNITNKVVASNINRDNAYVFGSPLDKTREIRGTIPKNRRAFTIKAAIHFPEEILAKQFLDALINEGVLITGSIKLKETKKISLKSIYVQESPTLAEIAEVLNHKSVNLFAEHLVKQLAFKKTGLGNRETGIQIITEYFKSKDISRSVFIEDGSGLSHFNAVSPRFYTEILELFKNNTSFVQSLPNAGEGTISNFQKENFPGKSLKAKSGSMTRVRCYTGYLKTTNGEQLAFAIMFNHFSGSHSKLIGEIEKLLLSLRLDM